MEPVCSSTTRLSSVSNVPKATLDPVATSAQTATLETQPESSAQSQNVNPANVTKTWTKTLLETVTGLQENVSSVSTTPEAITVMNAYQVFLSSLIINSSENCNWFICRLLRRCSCSSERRLQALYLLQAWNGREQ